MFVFVASGLFSIYIFSLCFKVVSPYSPFYVPKTDLYIFWVNDTCPAFVLYKSAEDFTYRKTLEKLEKHF